MSKFFVVELQPGCWIAAWEGDPGRTLVLSSAQRFESEHLASIALADARQYRPFINARILEDRMSIKELMTDEEKAALEAGLVGIGQVMALVPIVDGRVDKLAERIEKLEKRIEELNSEIDKTQRTMAARIFEEGVARIGALAAVEKRLAALERLMDLIAHPLIALFTDAQAALRDS